MPLSDRIPDDAEREEFVRVFGLATASAMQDAQPLAEHMTEDEIADFIEAKLRPVVGDYYLARPELLILARDVKSR